MAQSAHHSKGVAAANSISRALDLCVYVKDIILDLSRPAKPRDNGSIEAIKSKPPSESLNVHWFMSLADSPEKLKIWRRHYNEDRTRSAIGFNVLSALHCPGGTASRSP